MVYVIARVRPLTLHESTNPNNRPVVTCLDKSLIVDSRGDRSGRQPLARQRQFPVDHVLGSDSKPMHLFSHCRETVMGVFDGINGSILAYGATGSGKTYSMFGGEYSRAEYSGAGVVDQAMQEILAEKLRLETEGKMVVVTMSFVEVYNEDVFDLLAPAGRTKLVVLDVGGAHGSSDDGTRPRGGMSESLKVRGLNDVQISNMNDLAIHMDTGHRNRTTASTYANVVSSRSHAIITVEVEVRDSVDSVRGTFAKLRMCDLAGSERAAASSNSGTRLAEGGNINKSLLALGSVVQALAKNRTTSAQSQNGFVPYRGSKLTRLLKDCIGGNCRTVMLFCLSPSSQSREETLNTMLFAMQAKQIQVAAQANRFTVDVAQVTKEQEALVEKLRQQVTLLTEENESLRRGELVSSRAAQSVAGAAPQRLSLSPSSPASPATESSDGAPQSEGSAQQLERIVREKEKFRRDQKAAEESLSYFDNRIRELSARIAAYEGSRVLQSAPAEPPPVGIAGSHQEIFQLRKNMEAERARAASLQRQHDEIDVKATRIINDIRQQKQTPMLELQLENARLQKTIVEAECLAAFYHNKFTTLETKERNEWRPAVSQCIAALKDFLAIDHADELKVRAAHLAIAAATIPNTETEKILEMHHKYVCSVMEGKPLSTSQIVPHRASGTLCANPFLTEPGRAGRPAHGEPSNGDNGGVDCTATRRAHKAGLNAVPVPGAWPLAGRVGQVLLPSPLTSPAALHFQLKKERHAVSAAEKASVTPTSSPVSSGVGATSAVAGSNTNSASKRQTPPVACRSPVAERPPWSTLRQQLPAQHVDVVNMNVTGSAIRPSSIAGGSTAFVRLNTASLQQPSGHSKKAPAPRVEKENAALREAK